MARAFAKVSVHKKGGATNAEYIGRPQERPDPERSPEQDISAPRRSYEQTARHLFELREETTGTSASRISGDREDNPVWTWNAPQCVTGDTYGIEGNKQAQAHLKNGVRPSLIPPSQPVLQSGQTLKLSIDEKRQNAISYFSMLAELEERKGGVSHFRLVLTTGPEVTNRQMKVMVNAFLGENFPLARAMVAIHRDTAHTHAHLHVHARQLDNKRINLGQKYFQLDESWMKISSEQLRDSEIYDKHLALKKVTLEWKERAEEARSKGESIPPKDDRWRDHHETFLRFQPWDDRWCGRLMAQTRFAEKKVEFLTVTKAMKKEVAAATREARWLRERLEAAAEKRRSSARSEAKRWLPAEIITVSEARDLATFERAIEQKSRGIQPESSTSVVGSTRHQSQSTVNKQGSLIFEEPIAPRVQQSATENDHITEVNRVQIASTNKDDLRGKQKDESRSSVEITRQAKKRTAPRPHSSEQQLGFNLEVLDHPAVTPNHPDSRQQNTTVAIPGGNSPKMASGILTDDNLSRLIVRAELAEARLIALQAEEAEFKATPHRWLSPARGISLKEIEEQINAAKQAKKIEALVASKEDIQKEIAVERVALRERRMKAEEEVKALQAHISQEKTARANLNLPMPLMRWTAEDVHELAAFAESAREPRLFKRAYGIESDRVLRDSQVSPDKATVRQLEARYIGLELKAEIALDQSEQMLARALQHPEKIMLPGRDLQGRDIAVSLEQIRPQKNIKGWLKRVVEAAEDRRFRQQLETTKDSYLQHLHVRCAVNKAYYEATREVANECRARSREQGFNISAPPDLTREELRGIEIYAERRTSPRSQFWLFACRQANISLDQKSNALRVTPVVPEEPSRPYTVPEDIQKRRLLLEKESLRRVEEKIRDRKNAPMRQEPIPLEPDRQSEQRSGRGRGRS